MVTGIRSRACHFTATRRSLFEHGEDVVHRLGGFVLQAGLEALHVLVCQLVQPLRAEPGEEVVLQDGLLRVDAGRFLPVGLRVALDEAGRELGQGRGFDFRLLGFWLFGSVKSRYISRSCAQRWVPVLEVTGDFLRSRMTSPLGSFTTISTSHPPFRYGLIFTLIVGTSRRRRTPFGEGI